MNDVIWKDIDALWFLWLLPLAGVLAVVAHRRTRRAARMLVGDVMTRRLMPDLSPSGPLLRGLLFTTGAGLVIVACARPCWDFDYITIDARGVDVVVALDVSRSMLADDGGESRLDRAKAAVRGLVEGLTGDRVALLLFAGERVLTCPLTHDRGFFMQALAEASPEYAGRGGTKIGPALESALEVLDEDHGRDKVCVLVTDAGDQDSFPKTAAGRLARRNVRVIGLGIGRTEAPNEPLVLDGQVVRRADGTPVLARVDEALLRDIVAKTHGLYIPPEQTHRLEELYRRYVDPLEKGEAEELQERQYREQYQWFLLPGLLLLIIQAGLSPYRKRAARLSPAILVGVALSLGACGVDDQAAVEAATAAMASGDPEVAISALELALEDDQDDPVILYDLACAQQAAGHRELARKTFGRVLSLGARDLRARTEVNLALIDVEVLEETCGKDPEEAGDTVRDEIRSRAEMALDRLQLARELDPDLAEAREKQDVLARWLRVLKDAWAQRDREARRRERREKKGVTFMLALIGDQARIARQLEGGEPMHTLALDQQDLIADLDLVEERIGDDAPKLDEGGKKAVLEAVSNARPLLEASARNLADANILEAALAVGRGVRRLIDAYVEWADVGAALQMVGRGQAEIARRLAPLAETGSALPEEIQKTVVEAQTDQKATFDRIARRIRGLGPDAAQQAWLDLAAAVLPRVGASMEDAARDVERDPTEAGRSAADAARGLAHLAEDWGLQKQKAGKLARGLALRERDVARALAAADPFAFGGSGPSMGKRFSMQARRIGYLEAILRKEVMSSAPEDASDEETKALEQRLATLDARRKTAARAHDDAAKAYEKDGWPPSQDVIDGLDGARGALRDLWLSLASFEESLEAAAEEQRAAAAISAQAGRLAGEDDSVLPEALRAAPFLLADQAKEQDLVVGLVRRLVERLPRELAMVDAKKPASDESAPTPEQVEAAQLSVAYGVITDLLNDARTQAAKASVTLRPASSPTKATELGALFARATPAQTEAAELLEQALDELRRARLGLGEVAHAVMRGEGLLLTLARDLAAGLKVESGGQEAKVEDVLTVQQDVIGPMVARVPAALERTIAQLRPKGGEGQEPGDEQLRQFEQTKLTLEAMAGQLEEAHGRAVARFKAGEASAGRDAVDLAWQVSRQVWSGFADLQKLLEEGIHEETQLIARTGAFQGAAEGVPDVRKSGAITDQKRTEELIPRMIAAVRHQAGEAGGGGQPAGGLPKEVVELAERNLPLARDAMVEAAGGLAEGRWTAVRTQQEKARRLLEEILRKLKESQQNEKDQKQQQQQQQQPQQDQDQKQSPEERKRQQRAVSERNEKMKRRAQQNRKRPPVQEDW